ncbi:MAG: hypothetical protein ACR2NS_03355 [Gemmatimonadaceae bacterium]
MGKQRTDGVAICIVEVIELGERQSLDGSERRGPRVGQDADKSSNRRRIARDRFDS